jgi:hypothetical protein
VFYFGVEAKKANLQKAAGILSLLGSLIPGSAETTTNLDDSFERLFAASMLTGSPHDAVGDHSLEDFRFGRLGEVMIEPRLV